VRCSSATLAKLALQLSGGNSQFEQSGRPFSAGLWQTVRMAKGWDSKSVESQIESATEAQTAPASPRLTPQQIAEKHELEGLELSRARVLQDLSRAKHPRHCELLEVTLRHLDAKIAALRPAQGSAGGGVA
jgi:hypothetical protein